MRKLIYVNPVALGGGRPLFPDGKNFTLKLDEIRSYGCVVDRLKYGW